MKKVLFMHGGSGNHGCEAIIRTTAELLGGPDDLILWSLAKQEDVHYGIVPLVERIVESEELSRFSPAYFEALLRRKLLRQPEANLKVFLKQQFQGNIAFSVGGDNYCYPWSSNQAVKLNREIRKYAKATVLWGCSVNPDAITPEVREDLANYDLITARESITYQLLKPINPNTVLVADPAFLLDTQYLPLPGEFAEGNTVGINVSPMIMDYSTEGKLVFANYEHLIRFLLESTDMHVCLIPHVVWEHNDDRVPCRILHEKFRHTGRVTMISDSNCCALKGVIARCRFFVGTRTHATIAAYSSCVPTLAVGYSVKARGIAKDLFGTEENYVLPVQSIRTDADLTTAFRWLMAHEHDSRQTLTDILPDYLERSRSGRLHCDKLFTQEGT